MTITNGYCTLAEFKARFYPAGLVDTTDDTVIEQVVQGVSRLIDKYCKRRFYTTANDETRYFTAEFAGVLDAWDVLSVTTLATDDDGDRVYENTWAGTDYDLEPYNATLDGQPYTEISVTPQGDYTFPVGVKKGVKIIGKWGYSSSTPDMIHEACLIQCLRIFKRKDAPFGVTGSAEMGQLQVIPRLDPDVRLLLDAYKRVPVNAV